MEEGDTGNFRGYGQVVVGVKCSLCPMTRVESMPVRHSHSQEIEDSLRSLFRFLNVETTNLEEGGRRSPSSSSRNTTRRRRRRRGDDLVADMAGSLCESCASIVVAMKDFHQHFDAYRVGIISWIQRLRVRVRVGRRDANQIDDDDERDGVRRDFVAMSELAIQQLRDMERVVRKPVVVQRQQVVQEDDDGRTEGVKDSSEESEESDDDDSDSDDGDDDEDETTESESSSSYEQSEDDDDEDTQEEQEIIPETAEDYSSGRPMKWQRTRLTSKAAAPPPQPARRLSLKRKRVQVEEEMRFKDDEGHQRQEVGGDAGASSVDGLSVRGGGDSGAGADGGGGSQADEMGEVTEEDTQEEEEEEEVEEESSGDEGGKRSGVENRDQNQLQVEDMEEVEEEGEEEESDSMNDGVSDETSEEEESETEEVNENESIIRAASAQRRQDSTLLPPQPKPYGGDPGGGGPSAAPGLPQSSRRPGTIKWTGSKRLIIKAKTFVRAKHRVRRQFCAESFKNKEELKIHLANGHKRNQPTRLGQQEEKLYKKP